MANELTHAEKPEVFLSYMRYSSDDKLSRIDNFHNKLEAYLEDITVFEDRLDISNPMNRNIALDELDMHLKEDVFLLPVISYNYFHRPWCCYELLFFYIKEIAFKRPNSIIPIIFDDIDKYSKMICRKKDEDCRFDDIVEDLSYIFFDSSNRSKVNQNNLVNLNCSCPIVKIYKHVIENIEKGSKPDFKKELFDDKTICAKLYHKVSKNDDLKDFKDNAFLELVYCKPLPPIKEVAILKEKIDNLATDISVKYDDLNINYMGRQPNGENKNDRTSNIN